MKFLCLLVLVYSLLLHLKLADGFSAVKPPSFGRSNKLELPLLFNMAPASFARNFMVDRSPLLRWNLQILSATKEEDEEVEKMNEKLDARDDNAEFDKKIVGRKKRLNMGYQLSFVTYMASAFLTLLNYGRSSPQVLYYIFGGGPLSMAVILYILKGAASHDRLGSDTYKRLNVAVISYAITRLLIPTGTLGWIDRLGLKVPAFLALVNGIKGYGYGCLGWDKSKDTYTIFADVKEGIQSTLKGMAVVKGKSLGYLFGTLLLGAMFLFKLKDLVSILVFHPETVTKFGMFTRLSKLARFGLMTTIMYTLKDASDRDRLSGSTFVQLNYLASAAFLSIAAYLIPTMGTLSANIQILTVGALSAMTFFKGYSNMKPSKE